MKSSVFIKLLLAFVVMASSCKPYNYNKYKPQTYPGQTRLLRLNPVFPNDELKLIAENYRMVSGEWKAKKNDIISDIKNIHTDGLKALSTDSGSLYGYYTFHIKETEITGSDLGIIILGIYTGTILLGLPTAYWQNSLEIEFLIFDAKKNLVAKYVSKIEPKKTKTWAGLYFSYNGVNASKISYMKAHKLAFEEFIKFIDKDIDVINTTLLGGGTVKIEHSNVFGNAEQSTIYLDPNRKIDEEKSSGTGFLISKNGYVITNHHVIENARKIELYFPTDSFTTKYIASVINTDIDNDIAILKIDSGFTSLEELPYTFSYDYNVSDNVFTIGYPQPDIMGATYKYTKGEISSLSGIENNVTMMQITTPIQPGNSGGPLFDRKGNVVGITTSTLNPFYTVRYHGNIPQNVNYAVKSDYIWPLAKQYVSQQQNNVAEKPLVEQIKILSKFICMIRTY